MALVYLDSSIVIYLVERHPLYAAPIERALAGSSALPATSPLTRLEVLVKPLQEDRRDLVDLYSRFLSATRLLPIDRETFERALHLRVDFRLRTADALHLAVAHQSGCEAFWTNDNRLAAAAGGLNVNILTE